MNIKQLSEFFGKSITTLRRIIAEIGFKSIKGKIRIYTKKEVEAIAMLLYRNSPIPKPIKEAIIYTYSNGKGQPMSNGEASALNKRDIELISTIVSMTVSKTMESLNNRVNNIESKFEERKALLPAPQKSDRDNLNQIIRNHAYKKEVNYTVIWGELYKEAYYRLNINLKERAKNRNMSIINYAESENLLGELLSIAMEVFK